MVAEVLCAMASETPANITSKKETSGIHRFFIAHPPILIDNPLPKFGQKTNA
jgi:hypothetical protein